MRSLAHKHRTSEKYNTRVVKGMNGGTVVWAVLLEKGLIYMYLIVPTAKIEINPYLGRERLNFQGSRTNNTQEYSPTMNTKWLAQSDTTSSATAGSKHVHEGRSDHEREATSSAPQLTADGRHDHEREVMCGLKEGLLGEPKGALLRAGVLRDCFRSLADSMLRQFSRLETPTSGWSKNQS